MFSEGVIRDGTILVEWRRDYRHDAFEGRDLHFNLLSIGLEAGLIETGFVAAWVSTMSRDARDRRYRGLVSDQTTIDVNHLSGDVAGLRRNKKSDQGRYFLRFSDPA